MEIVLHIFGVCGDAHSHFDLIDLLLYGTTITPLLVYIKLKFKNIVNFFKNNSNNQ